MRRILGILIALLAACLSGHAQSKITTDFKEVCDSLSVLMTERTSVEGSIRLKAVMKRGSCLDFYFTESLGDFPFRPGDAQWFRKALKAQFPEKYSGYSLGEVKSRKIDIEKLEVAELTFNGSPAKSSHRTDVPDFKDHVVRRVGEQNFDKGMSGRTIALWQSHGKAFSSDAGLWQWQRPCLFQTVEDMFTQGFVLPYLAPMLENAGAYVMIPRERDVQVNEVIADNEPTCGSRGTSEYVEKGKWADAGSGFADLKPVYTREDEPFKTGTARKADCTGGDKASTATWRPDIPERGSYAVYISYLSLPNSTSNASYTVHHMGGSTSFIVNQKLGGGTWIYLGTFEFEKGTAGYVSLTSRTPDGFRYEKGTVVTADAVKFGGGMGNIAGTPKDTTITPLVSGLPRSAEAATYWLQWAGADRSIWQPKDAKTDYQEDFMCRGDWVDWISGGSYMNPDRPGKGIPVDLSLGFHTDAGVNPADTIIGTLAIYTYKSENKTVLPGGESRMTSREYADIVQSQIVNDLREEFREDWSRRQIWDRGYRESRTPSCPAMLLELLSHQNFEDMKYGLDPCYRFTVSRAIYKGMLKYLSNRYGIPYVVQPLPVTDMGVKFSGDRTATISWNAAEDPLEPTADATGFILYTRIGNGGFDTGRRIKAIKGKDGSYSFDVSIGKGQVYSFRIAAYNDGGKSFQSETMSIGLPADGSTDKAVLVVNNFDRISGPAFFDTPSYAGFDNRIDSGVPDGRDITFIGEMYENRRHMPWVSNANSGFGSSYSDYAGKTVAGNTFDFTYTHGQAVMKAGYAFFSCSNEAFCSDSTFRKNAWSADIICGNQVTTSLGESFEQKYSVFPVQMQDAIRAMTSDGGNILISGSNIGTDAWDQIYPYTRDKDDATLTQKFIKEVLGYRWVTGFAGRSGEVCYAQDTLFVKQAARAGEMYTRPNPQKYCIESPDGISAANSKGKVIMRYADTDTPAGIRFEGGCYRTVCLGFPIEALKEDEDIERIIKATLEYFNR